MKPAVQTPSPPDFRLALQSELIRRCRTNPKYSLRAFARFLGLESSRLSKILRGERPINPKLLTQLGQQLGLSPKEIKTYTSSIPAPKYRFTQAISAHIEKVRYLQLSQDTFETIEDWHHYAILELMKVRGFKADPKWLGRVLGASVSEVRACVERLQRVGLLRMEEDGQWTDISEGFSTDILSNYETTVARRRSQKTLLNLAIEALERTPMDRRDQSSMMMATHSSKMAEAKDRIRKFRQELCAFLEDCEEKDTIYQLSVSLFPLAEPHLEIITDHPEKGTKAH